MSPLLLRYDCASSSLIEAAYRSQRWVRERPTLIDIDVVALVAILAGVENLDPDRSGLGSRDTDLLVYVLVGAAALALFWMRSQPIILLVAVLSLICVSHILGYPSYHSPLGFAAFYAVAAHAEHRGQTIAGERGVGAQLTIQKAEALARLGARREADQALARAQAILEKLPASTNPLHHFYVDHDKFVKALMHIHLIQGDDRSAAMLSDELERKFTQSDGTMTKPMRVADARSVRAVIAARQGDLDHALALGHSALDIDRQTIPSLVKNTTELAEFLTANHANAPGVKELLPRRDQLAQAK